MAKHSKGGPLAHAFTRQERGTAIPITSRQIQNSDGTTSTVHAMNLSEAQVPDRSYFGNMCSVMYERETVRIVFGQPKLGGEGLRSMVIISMTPLAANHFVHSIESLNNPSLAVLIQRDNVSPEPLSAFPSKEPDQTAELVASIVAAAFSGRDACLDFYHANAFSYLAIPTTNKIHLEPVVRIDTRTSLIVSLVAAIRELRARFPVDNTPWEKLHE